MTMGQPLSLKELRAKTIDTIAGYVRLEHGDNLPTADIFRVEHQPVPDGVFLADPAVPPWKYAGALSMNHDEIPEELHYENIHYYDEPADIPLGMNEVEVPDSELVEFNTLYAARQAEFKQLLYKSAASIGALSDASDYVEAALRSGLDIDVEMDEALAEAFVPIARLDAIAAMARTTSLTKEQQESYVEKVMAFMAEKTVHALQKFDTGAEQRRGLANQRELYARVRAANQHRSQSEQAQYFHDSRMQDSSTYPPAHQGSQIAQQTQWGVRGTRK